MTTQVQIKHESKLVQGHVLDCARAPLLAALRRYDPLLYFKWNPKKRAGAGIWELRRKPEFKSVRQSRYLDTPKGRVFVRGDVFEFEGMTISTPQYHETDLENHVKDFDRLTYGILAWVADHDLFQYGFKGKNVMSEAEYREAKYEEKIDDDSYAEKQYMIKQHKTEFQDFREYILAGGSPYDLMRYWGK